MNTGTNPKIPQPAGWQVTAKRTVSVLPSAQAQHPSAESVSTPLSPTTPTGLPRPPAFMVLSMLPEAHWEAIVRKGRAFSVILVATARISTNWSLSASYTDTTSSLAARYGVPGLYSRRSALHHLNPLRCRAVPFILGPAILHSGFSFGWTPKRQSWTARVPRGRVRELKGHVFLDANDNRAERLQTGVTGIIVILDGIQGVRTDQSGYYYFDGIADGPHRVTLNADTLPLPWVIKADDQYRAKAPYFAVEVGVRSSTSLYIAAVRE